MQRWQRCLLSHQSRPFLLVCKCREARWVSCRNRRCGAALFCDGRTSNRPSSAWSVIRSTQLLLHCHRSMPRLFHRHTTRLMTLSRTTDRRSPAALHHRFKLTVVERRAILMSAAATAPPMRRRGFVRPLLACPPLQRGALSHSSEPEPVRRTRPTITVAVVVATAVAHSTTGSA